MPRKIAILGWGSLLWDPDPRFDKHHTGWRKGGPLIRLEFSQIAPSQDDGISLVIDRETGAPCKVAYTFSRRAFLQDAFTDLQAREQTTHRNIGCIRFDTGEEHGHDQPTLASIRRWAKNRRLTAVIWTDTPSNWKESRGRKFSVRDALSYIRQLKPQTKCKVAAYVWRSPGFVDTPLRRALEGSPWFARS